MSELGYLITQQVHKKMRMYNLHCLRLWFDVGHRPICSLWYYHL